MWQESDDKIVIVDKRQFELTDYFMQKKKNSGSAAEEKSWSSVGKKSGDPSDIEK